MITAFVKIFAIGTDYIRDIFNEEVEITEKIDGSQFDFGNIGGIIHMRSKGAQLFVDNPEKMFAEGISYVESISDRLPEGKVFFCEYMKKPKHNTLKYDRIPKNHIMLFSVMNVATQSFEASGEWANILDIEHVPVLFNGKINCITDFAGILETKSVLGGANIEGVVVKNYFRRFLLGGQPMPLMAGKFVSESFKEVHRERWGEEEKGKNKLEVFFESFRTPARWGKAVQHLQEKGELENEPKDIGKLFKEVHTDIEAEEKEAVKDFLWRHFCGELKRKATAGMPEWYKNKLMESSFEEQP